MVYYGLDQQVGVFITIVSIQSVMCVEAVNAGLQALASELACIRHMFVGHFLINVIDPQTGGRDIGPLG